MKPTRIAYYLLLTIFLHSTRVASATVYDHSALHRFICSSEKIKLNRVFNIGDSQSDSGNFYQYARYLTGIDSTIDPLEMALYPPLSHWVPAQLFRLGRLGTLPDTPYWKGRFSDGPVSSEIMAEAAGLNTSSHFINLAYGGSPTLEYFDFLGSFWNSDRSIAPDLAGFYRIIDSFWSGKWVQISMTKQARVIMDRFHDFDWNDLLIISGGANDYVNLYWDPEKIVTTQYELIRSMLDHGVKAIVWGTMPDVTQTPCLMNSVNKEQLQKVIGHHNRRASSLFLQLVEEYPDRVILFLDNDKIFGYLMEHAKRAGMETEISCLPVSFSGCDNTADKIDIREARGVGVCDDPKNFFFWDAVHPGSRIGLWAGMIGCQLMAHLNMDVVCPTDDQFDAKSVLHRYLSEATDSATSSLRQFLMDGQCPAVQSGSN